MGTEWLYKNHRKVNHHDHRVSLSCEHRLTRRPRHSYCCEPETSNRPGWWDHDHDRTTDSLVRPSSSPLLYTHLTLLSCLTPPLPFTFCSVCITLSGVSRFFYTFWTTKKDSLSNEQFWAFTFFFFFFGGPSQIPSWNPKERTSKKRKHTLENWEEGQTQN